MSTPSSDRRARARAAPPGEGGLPIAWLLPLVLAALVLAAVLPVMLLGYFGARDNTSRLLRDRSELVLDVVVERVAAALDAELIGMGSAGAKAMAVVDGRADIYLHAGGQYEWDNCAPVAVALAAGLHASRIDGSPLRLRMDGRGIYRWATTSLPDLARRACAAAGIEPADLAAFVPHQANLRITESVVKSLALPSSVVVARDVVDSGNTSAASVPLALARVVEEGQVRTGDLVLLLGFGAGLTAAGQVVRCP